MKHAETPRAYPSYRAVAPKLVGGSLCLDFVNTVEWRGAPERCDRLVDYGELAAWAAAAGALPRRARARLDSAARLRPGAAAAALREAVELRETLAAVFGARRPAPALLARLNDWLARAPQRTRIAAGVEGYAWVAGDAREPLLAPLWPVVWSAADLLTSGRAARASVCADRKCGWMFLDESRSVRRRWCSMESCGNRAKARRHYGRRRAA
jgi:predicted RNA-binding Zn ribbon-like protein